VLTASTICIAGKNQVAVDVLRAAGDRTGAEIVALPIASDQGTDGWQPSLKKAAEELGYAVVDANWVQARADLCFLSLEYDKIIRPAAFASSLLFNMHFSLLPSYRGCNTSIWPILNGEKQHGVTLHEIDPGIDTGAIIDRRAFEIDGLTARELYFRCMELGASLALEWLPRLMVGHYPRVPQDSDAGSLYMRSDLDFDRKHLDFSMTAEEVLRHVRAFTFPEYQRPVYCGREVLSAEFADGSASAQAGIVIEGGSDWMVVQASDRPVRLRLLSHD
jgi:methionyl-tRNA formyltransferase